MTAVVQQDPAGEGKAAVEALIKLKKGEKIEPIINIPVTIVTKDNVESVTAACSSRRQVRDGRGAHMPRPRAAVSAFSNSTVLR